MLSYVGWVALEKYDIMTFGEFLFIWAILFLISTAVIVLQKEKDTADIPKVSEAYQEMLLVLRIPAVQQFIVILLTCKIAFSPECMSQTMLVGPVGLPKSDFVTMGLVMAIPMLLAPKLVDRFTASSNPFNLFTYGVIPRIALSLASGCLFLYAPEALSIDNGDHQWFYISLYVIGIVQVLISQAMFCGQMGFFSRIADPRIGGTYMTLLNTIANLSYKWPTAVFMSSVAYFSDPAWKAWTPSGLNNGDEEPPVVASDAEETYDGFYICLVLASLFGVVVWLPLVWSKLKQLQAKPLHEWHVNMH